MFTCITVWQNISFYKDYLVVEVLVIVVVVIIIIIIIIIIK